MTRTTSTRNSSYLFTKRTKMSGFLLLLSPSRPWPPRHTLNSILRPSLRHTLLWNDLKISIGSPYLWKESIFTALSTPRCTRARQMRVVSVNVSRAISSLAIISIFDTSSSQAGECFFDKKRLFTSRRTGLSCRLLHNCILMMPPRQTNTTKLSQLIIIAPTSIW